MKKTILTLCLSALLGSLCVAGPQSFSGKEKQVIAPPPPCPWYCPGEWVLGLWAAYAFTDDSENHDFHFHNKQFDEADRQFDQTGQPVFLGDSEHDMGDHAWGGGGDLKYFFTRNLGVGLEGFALDGNNTAGAVLGTFTVRFPIGASRFAPYVFGGVGGLFGAQNDQTDFFFTEQHVAPGVEEGETESIVARKHDSDDARVIGQLGGGLEVRLTRHSEASRLAVGVMADFTWNFTGGDNNQNFGMVRTGLTLAY
jgi:hypothetical protein